MLNKYYTEDYHNVLHKIVLLKNNVMNNGIVTMNISNFNDQGWGINESSIYYLFRK